MSEFLLNSCTAASLGVPVIFIAGDQAICGSAKKLVPDLSAVITKKGTGGSTYCLSSEKVIEELRAKTKEALQNIDRCHMSLPESFEYTVSYKDWKKAYQMSFFPGMESVDAFTNRLKTEDWFDVVTAHWFVVY